MFNWQSVFHVNSLKLVIEPTLTPQRHAAANGCSSMHEAACSTLHGEPIGGA